MTKELKNRILENKVLTHDERMEIIKALEIVEEFEKAQIITGGRLNGRTYAYKCGLEDGKRKALEQQPSEDCVSRQAVLETIDDCNSDGLKGIFCSYNDGERFKECIKKLPPVTPTHGKCKDCKHYYMDEDGCGYHCEKFDYTRFPVYADFYCADFEKRGNEK